MAEMQFDLVSPERSLASLSAGSVQIPGADGDMTVMQGHAPTITTLRPGFVAVDAGGQTREFLVTGGFAEISADAISVLAEKAVARGDVVQTDFDAMFDAAQAEYDRVKSAGGMVDDAAKLLGDMVALGGELGLSTKQPSL